MNDAIDETPVAASATAGRDGDWQAMPPRARMMFVLDWLPAAIAFGAAGGVAGFFLVALTDLAPPWLGALVGAVVGVSFGLWVGMKQYRCSFWRHDVQGLAVRRGKFFQRETRVPASRVQHLDIKRGPLQRGRDLATLVVHTAGTRHSSVTVPHLDVEDAERLREALSRQIEPDYDRDDPD